MSQTGQPTAPRLYERAREIESEFYEDRTESGTTVAVGNLALALAKAEAAASVPAPEQDEAVRALKLIERWGCRASAFADEDPLVWDRCRDYEYRDDQPTGDPDKDRCHPCIAHAALATPPPVPTAPAALWRLQGEYVVDRDGLVWRVVRDGGMATRADFTGIESIGIETLRSTKGPLTSLNDFVDAAAGAVPAAPGLDVERLAAALDVLSEDGLEYDLMAPEEREDRDDAAERLAAEYARLSPDQEEAPDG